MHKDRLILLLMLDFYSLDSVKHISSQSEEKKLAFNRRSRQSVSSHSCVMPGDLEETEGIPAHWLRQHWAVPILTVSSTTLYQITLTHTTRAQKLSTLF